MLDIGVKVIGISVGMYTLLSNLWRLKVKKKDPTISILLTKLEERDQKIIQLQIELQAWKLHHERLTNQKHLHSS